MDVSYQRLWDKHLRGEDLSVFGEGTQTRSFCYVDDLVEGIYRLLFSDYSNPVNLGNPDEITIIEFADEILKLTNSESKNNVLSPSQKTTL